MAYTPSNMKTPNVKKSNPPPNLAMLNNVNAVAYAQMTKTPAVPNLSKLLSEKAPVSKPVKITPNLAMLNHANDENYARMTRTPVTLNVSKMLSETKTYTGLDDKDFVKIKDSNGTTEYYGGQQAWYYDPQKKPDSGLTKYLGGCGPVAAANQMAYMAKQDPDLAALYDNNPNNISKSDFEKFQEKIYSFVKPVEVPVFNNWTDSAKTQKGIPTVGVTNWVQYAIGVEKYAKSKGIKLRTHAMPQLTTFAQTKEFIKGGLKAGSPVALLNISTIPANMTYHDPATNTVGPQSYNMHWVTVTGIEEDYKTGKVTLEVSTWGGKATIELNSLMGYSSSKNENTNVGLRSAVYFTK